MLDRPKRLHELPEASRREHERIAAREDHLPDVIMRADIGDGGVELRAREGARASNRLAAETEAAIGCADMDGLEQHPVRIAAHDALDGAMRVVPDRAGHLLRPALELGLVGNELARNGVMRIARIDELGNVRRSPEPKARGTRL